MGCLEFQVIQRRPRFRKTAERFSRGRNNTKIVTTTSTLLPYPNSVFKTSPFMRSLTFFCIE